MPAEITQTCRTILETVWPSQSATGQLTTAGSGATAAQPRPVPVKTSTSRISKLRLVVLRPDPPLDQLQDQVITPLEMLVPLSGQTNAMVHATADGAGLQAILLNGTHPMRSADANEPQTAYNRAVLELSIL